MKRVYFRSYFGQGDGVSREMGALEGDTWTWNGEFQTVKGQTIQTGCVNAPISPTYYAFKRHAGGDWVTLQEGTATKVK